MTKFEANAACQVSMWHNPSMSESFPEDEQEVVSRGDDARENDAVVAQLRRASQQLYDAIQSYLIDIPDSQLPPELVAAFDAIEAAWRRSDGQR